jgi:heterodisulfide reductase subunit C
MREGSTMKEDAFFTEVTQSSGEKVQACFQCQKCSAGCPVAYAMDLLPNQVIRHIQYGHREKVLSSHTIWICASCYTCSVRCPNNIDIARIMDALRAIALRSGARPAEREVPLFHSAFLDTIKSKGRIHELSLILQLKSKTKDFLKDAGLGWKMFLRRKIKLLPSRMSAGKEIQDIFSAYEKRVKR